MAATREATSKEKPAGPSIYDGFISYSHAADGLLAPRLQSGLQRFAKPWWKRRALRIFRDEASLSANPHLWLSITEALDGSEWFVLLLSEEAAGSEWVNREVEYWTIHKDPARIIPVVTDGHFSWADGDLSVASSVVPPALHGVFRQEPRWVDLRWARSDAQLDLKNPRFLGAVADVASAIRGVPKHELESEEVHQHRRTLRAAWTAGTAILLFAIAATVGAIVGITQSNEARQQRAQAERQAQVAVSERDAARSARDEADALALAESRARAEAESLARVSTARELAAASVNARSVDFDRSLLMAVAAAEVTLAAGESIVTEALDALHAAIANQRIVMRLETGGGPGVHWSPDGARLLTFEMFPDPGAAVWDVETGRSTALIGGAFSDVAMSADGRRVLTAASFNFLSDAGSAGRSFEGGETAIGEGVVIEVWDSSGRRLRSFWSRGSQGAVLAVHPTRNVVAIKGDDPVISIWDYWTGELLAEIQSRGAAAANALPGEEASLIFSPDGRHLAIAEPHTRTARVWETETWEPVWSTPLLSAPVTDVAFDPSSRRLATLLGESGGIQIWPLGSSEPDGEFGTGSRGTVMAWNHDGTAIAVSGPLRIVEVFDVATGALANSLAGHQGSVAALAYGPTGNHLASTDTTGSTIVWDLSPLAGSEVGKYELELSDVSAAKFLRDGLLVLASSDGGAAIFDPSGHVVVNSSPRDGPRSGWPAVISEDGRFLVVAGDEGRARILLAPGLDEVGRLPAGLIPFAISLDGGLIAGDRQTGAPVLVDTTTQEVVLSLDTSNGLGLGASFFAEDAAFSPDGTLVALVGDFGFWVYNIEEERLVAEVATDGLPGGHFISFSPDGTSLITRGGGTAGSIWIYRVSDLVSGGEVDELRRVRVDVLDNLVTGISFSADGSTMAVSGLDHTVAVWDTDLWTRRSSVQVGSPQQVVTVSHDGLFLMTATADANIIHLYTLDPAALIQIARDRAHRDLTDEECRRYLHRPDGCR